MKFLTLIIVGLSALPGGLVGLAQAKNAAAVPHAPHTMKASGKWCERPGQACHRRRAELARAAEMLDEVVEADDAAAVAANPGCFVAGGACAQAKRRAWQARGLVAEAMTLADGDEGKEGEDEGEDDDDEVTEGEVEARRVKNVPKAKGQWCERPGQACHKRKRELLEDVERVARDLAGEGAAAGDDHTSWCEQPGNPCYQVERAVEWTRSVHTKDVNGPPFERDENGEVNEKAERAIAFLGEVLPML